MVRKRKPKKWNNSISTRDLQLDHNKSKSNNLVDVRHSIIDEWILLHQEQLSIRDSISESQSKDWYCFTCKKTIHIDVGKLVRNGKHIKPVDFFCNDCKSKHTILTPDLIRYINSFYSDVKNTIKTNSNINIYL